MKPDGRKAISFHEAGHSAVWWSLGAAVESVTAGRACGLTVAAFGGDPRTLVLGLMGGPLALARVLGRRPAEAAGLPGAAGDAAAVALLLGDLPPRRQARAWRLAACGVEVLWPCVEEVALLLRRHGRLGAAEVHAACSRTAPGIHKPR